jgi:prephenate dehydrogenase
MSKQPRWPARGDEWSVVVVGCGLMGGSVAAAVRRRWPRAHMVGVDRTPVLKRAQQLDLIHEGATPGRLAAVLRRVQPRVVVLALPMDPLLRVLSTVSGVSGPARRLVLDLSSVKAPIVAAAGDCVGFVGGHPMAGRERGGVDQASPVLFRGRTFALCRGASTTDDDLRRAQIFAKGLGATPLVLDPVVHDQCVALTSHLPHVLAIALMQQAASLRSGPTGAGLPWSLAAGAWRDATRVARADPDMWNSILAHNRTAVSDGLGALIEQLTQLRAALDSGSTAPLTPQASGLDARAAARIRAQIDPTLPKSAPAPLRPPADISHDRKRLGRQRR